MAVNRSVCAKRLCPAVTLNFEITINFCFVSAQFQFKAHDHVGSCNSYAFLIAHNPLIFFGLGAGKFSTYSDVCSSYAFWVLLFPSSLSPLYPFLLSVNLSSLFICLILSFLFCSFYFFSLTFDLITCYVSYSLVFPKR